MYLERVNLHVMLFILCYTLPKALLMQTTISSARNENNNKDQEKESQKRTKNTSSILLRHRYKQETISLSSVYPASVKKMLQSKPTKRRRKDSTFLDKSTKINHVAYFKGHQIIRYSDLNLNFEHFTITMWVYIEGGEYRDSPILRLYNHCTFLELSSLEFGVTTIKKEKSILYFALRTSQSNSSSRLTTGTSIRFQRWTHVSISYDGLRMVLYVDRAKIGVVHHKQTGVFSSDVYPRCTTLDIGGHDEKDKYFRGAIDKISVVNEALSHRLISKRIFRQVQRLFVLKEDFTVKSGYHRRYHAVHNLMPELINERIAPEEKEKLRLPIPKCGHTLCDNPDVIRSYLSYPNVYMFRKQVRYRVVLITKDDGSVCKISENDIHRKHKTLSKVFRKEGISLYLDIAKFTKSNLCNKTVLISCYRPCPDDTAECEQSVPADRIGCQRKCSSEKLGNGRCDVECNNPDNGNNWDRGDCCNTSVTNVNETCYDPLSIHRAFIGESELKAHLNLTNSEAIVVLPVQLPDNFFGKSTYPWDDRVYSALGGVTINYKGFLPSSSSPSIISFSGESDVVDIIHELGHAFGLWHVHRGVSEVRILNSC